MVTVFVCLITAYGSSQAVVGTIIDYDEEIQVCDNVNCVYEEC